ncbi:transcriptional-regulating factor 1-like [Pempheris klunzingeri]|uniref:transcriptional-regulating factor 1-like n=1 Tax=Pempheris klunzingeri TaxID=3127111 RepID=UPI00397F9421
MFQVTSPHPQMTSPHPQVTSPHHQVTSPHYQVTSHHHHQVTSPHHQVTSPHHQVTSHHHHQATSPHHQVTSPHYQVTSHHHQVTSHSSHLLSHHQVTSPHLLPQSQATSPHLLPHPQVTSPHLLPHPQVTSPHLLPHPQVTSPLHLPPPQHLPTPPHLDPGFVKPDWSRPSPPPELSHLFRSCTSSQQVSPLEPDPPLAAFPTSDLKLNQTHCSALYGQVDPPGPVQDTWGGPGPAAPRLQSSLLGPVSGELSLGGWSSVDSSGPQFFYDSCYDNSAPQPFCSPNTPGPSPHYPPTSYAAVPEPPQSQRDQTALLDAAGDPDSRFPPQGRGWDVSGAAQTPAPPAEPSWGGSCGGGGPEDWSWLQPQNSEDPRSLPVLNRHMRSHSGSRSAAWMNKGEPVVQPSVSMVMPVSVPVQSRGRSRARRGAQKRCGRLSPATGGAVLYRSLLHRGAEEAVAGGDGGSGVHYTPPPMLCPLRAGPGLYCSLTTRRRQRAQTVQLHSTQDGPGDLVAMETASSAPGTNKPRINVGRGFQAEIPPLQARKHAQRDSHNALLLWTPWDDLELPVNQQRVEALVTMACSSVVPGGGASPEWALHVLSECGGDFLLTVEKLLSTPEASDNKQNPNRRRQSVGWSAAETRLLLTSLQLHHKDFLRVQRAVQTKSLSQCVEFYYLWKKKLSLSARTPAGLTVTLPNTNGQRAARSHDAS